MGRHRLSASIGPNEYYACKLCHQTSIYLASIRRHIREKVHKIPGDYEPYYEIRSLISTTTTTSVQAETTTNNQKSKTDEIPSGAGVDPKMNKKTTKKSQQDVGCQVDCLHCEQLKKRYEELEGIYKNILRNGEKAKTALAKLG